MKLGIITIMAYLAADGTGRRTPNRSSLRGRPLELVEPFNEARILPLQTVDPRKGGRHVIAHSGERHVGIGPVVRNLLAQAVELRAGDRAVPERHLCFG